MPIMDATNAASGSASFKAFTFNDNGDYVVYARVIDKDGGHTDYETTVRVNNVAPTATINGAPATSDEGDEISLTSTVRPFAQATPSMISTGRGAVDALGKQHPARYVVATERGDAAERVQEVRAEDTLFELAPEVGEAVHVADVHLANPDRVLSMARTMGGRTAEAIAPLRQALKLRPDLLPAKLD